ncbi:MAG: MFS transporter [Verrucomicrobia bacterium]|nr:MFS transporter [Verrucomicrobiota bacterium]
MSTPVFPEPPRPLWKDLLQPAVIVGALGYFVDIYDLTLFMTVREKSLAGLGLNHLISGAPWYQDLLSWQMAGMLLGGIFFGILGDRMGRLTTLFGSILLYSIANIANGMVDTFGAYAAWRFIAGIGLAGELGGCIALVSETLSKERRGYGTALVATVGVFGAVVAGYMADHVDAIGAVFGTAGWRVSYYIGGGLGLALLLLRVGVHESGMFQHAKESAGEGAVARGNFLALFTDRERFARYARCVLIGLPTWFMIGILVQRAATVFAPAAGIQGEKVQTNWAVASFYLGLTFGDLASGLASQLLQSRKKVVAAFLLFSLVCVGVYLYGAAGWTSSAYYRLIFLMGFGMGYWALFVTIAAEQFGTNLRATVATTVPNFARGSLVLLTFCFTMLIGTKEAPQYAPSTAGLVLGVVCFGAAFLALWKMEETFGKDLDYQEQK